MGTTVLNLKELNLGIWVVDIREREGCHSSMSPGIFLPVLSCLHNIKDIFCAAPRQWVVPSLTINDHQVLTSRNLQRSTKEKGKLWTKNQCRWFYLTVQGYDMLLLEVSHLRKGHREGRWEQLLRLPLTESGVMWKQDFSKEHHSLEVESKESYQLYHSIWTMCKEPEFLTYAYFKFSLRLASNTILDWNRK